MHELFESFNLGNWNGTSDLFESFSNEGWDPSREDDEFSVSLSNAIKSRIFADKMFTLVYKIPNAKVNRIKIFARDVFEKLNPGASWEVFINGNSIGNEVIPSGYYILTENDKSKEYLKVELYFPEWGEPDGPTNLSRLFYNCSTLHDIISIPKDCSCVRNIAEFFGKQSIPFDKERRKKIIQLFKEAHLPPKQMALDFIEV